MPSLWKHPSSPFWTACYTGPDGQRVKKSTKRKNRGEALAVCVEWAQAAEHGRLRTFTETQAHKVVSEIMEKATGEPVVFHNAEDYLRSWLADKIKSKAASTGSRYGTTVERFIAHLGKRAKLSVAAVGSKDIRTFRDKEVAEGKTAATANLAVKCLRIAFNLARRQGIITANPAEAVETLPHEVAERDTFTPEHIAALLKAAPSPDWRGAILAGYYTGARLQDVTNLRWEDVDLPEKVLHFAPRKTRQHKQTVRIPLHPDLESFLLERPAVDNPKDFLFPSLAGRKPGGAHGLSAGFSCIMAAAKIRPAIARERKGRGRRFLTLGFHSLRHTFNSNMANKGVAQEIRQQLTGHASAEMNKVYTHHELEPLRAAVRVLPSIKRA